MKPNLFPTVCFVALGILVVTSCSKNVQSLQPPLGVTGNAFPAGIGRSVVWDITLPATANSGAMEVTEWVSFTQGERNITTTSVDPGYVMVGGGAQVVDPGGNSGAVDAVLTGSFPVGTSQAPAFTTYCAIDKDHGGIFYTSDCYAYVIGIKLFSPSTGAPIATSVIIPHLRLDSVQSPPNDHPTASISTPAGYRLISGGAFDNYGSGYGNLLTQNNFSTAGSVASGKDQKQADVCSITDYLLSIDNSPIAGYGTIQLISGSNNTPVVQHLQGLFVSILGNYAVAGVGGLSTYTGYGRLLYGTYSSASNVGNFQSKDQDVSDISGSLYGNVTGIAPGN